MIRLHQERGNFQSYHSLRVTVGGTPSHVSRVTSNTDLDVVVPMRATGEVEIQLRDGTQVTASATFSVLDTDCRRFVMRIDGNQVVLLRIEPCFDSVNGNVATLDARLSFDLIDAGGQVLHTASIPHPLQTPTEVFSRSGNAAAITRRDPLKPAVFWVRFPNLPNARALKVYQVNPGIDLADSLNLEKRGLIDSLGISIQ
jgi:hypothetical protein